MLAQRLHHQYAQAVDRTARAGIRANAPDRGARVRRVRRGPARLGRAQGRPRADLAAAAARGARARPVRRQAAHRAGRRLAARRARAGVAAPSPRPCPRGHPVDRGGRPPPRRGPRAARAATEEARQRRCPAHVRARRRRRGPGPLADAAADARPSFARRLDDGRRRHRPGDRSVLAGRLGRRPRPPPEPQAGPRRSSSRSTTARRPRSWRSRPACSPRRRRTSCRRSRSARPASVRRCAASTAARTSPRSRWRVANALREEVRGTVAVICPPSLAGPLGRGEGGRRLAGGRGVDRARRLGQGPRVRRRRRRRAEPHRGRVAAGPAGALRVAHPRHEAP